MCNLYAITKSQEAIRQAAKALRDKAGNLPPLPGIFPDQTAPIVRTGEDGKRELVMMRWGFPSPPIFGQSAPGHERPQRDKQLLEAVAKTRTTEFRMQIKDILHIAIRTMDLAATEKFYGEVLGLKVDPKRPASVPAPGVWYDFVGTQIHVIAGPNSYGDADQNAFGGANIDHFAVRAVDYDGWRAHLEKHGCDYRQNTVASLGQWQLFTRDPNGIVIELQFIIADEPMDAKGPDGTKQYRFGYF